jgi:DNA (cytosine-5)-methyltransferase 1
MKLLDVFSGAGGAGKGYADAGFEVVGVDIAPQPRYPMTFIQADAITILERLAEGRIIEVNGRGYDANDFDAIHASPPCQAFTNAQKIMGNEHPDLVEPSRELLDRIGLPYVIENVPGAPLNNPVELCGAMFNLGTYRHRLFETNWDLTPPPHPPHTKRTTKMGRAPVEGEMMHVVGNFSGVAKARKAMGIDWMNRDELREAIPPLYSQYIGWQLAAHINTQAMEKAA